eukprot:SAG11_NODE_25350_length_360_cov_0.586207_2_plen_96_part_01
MTAASTCRLWFQKCCRCCLSASGCLGLLVWLLELGTAIWLLQAVSHFKDSGLYHALVRRPPPPPAPPARGGGGGGEGGGVGGPRARGPPAPPPPPP